MLNTGGFCVCIYTHVYIVYVRIYLTHSLFGRGREKKGEREEGSELKKGKRERERERELIF